MRHSLTLLFCFLALTAYGQIGKSAVRLSVNYPYIGSAVSQPQSVSILPIVTGFTAVTTTSTLKESYESNPGMDADFTVEVFSNKTFFLRTGLGVQYFNYRRNIEYSASSAPVFGIPNLSLPPGSGFGVITSSSVDRDSTGTILLSSVSAPGGLEQDSRIGRTTLLYLEAPVAIGKSFLKGRLQLQTGASISILIHATGYKQVFGFSGSQFKLQVEKDNSRVGLSDLTVNGVVNISYLITHRLSVFTNYQRSFTPIYTEGNRPGGKTYMNSFSLGIGFQLKRGA